MSEYKTPMTDTEADAARTPAMRRPGVELVRAGFARKLERDRADLLDVLSEMLGAAETDVLDDKSNVWRSLMLDAREIIAKAAT